MSVRNLTYLFKPGSVALIGATDRAKSVGAVVMRNLLQGGFSGPIMPVNPKHKAISGVLAYPDVKSLPVVPDLAIICTPALTVPNLIRELGERGTRAAVVITAGLSSILYEGNKTVAQAMLEAARPHLFRILGSNCLGLIVPGIGLNASFAHQPASSGRIAFVSQSGALCTAVLDWARPKRIGFSHFISLGDADDVNCADVLDYLGSDPTTRAILLYIEAIKERRKFMSAARAAARNKPVMVIKSGRVAEGAKAAASHTGALAGADDVYDSAFRRAGLLRVYDIEELFAAVETLARSRPARQAARLAVMTNGGGIGVMAVDNLIEGGGRLAKLSEKTIAALDEVLPPTWSRANPVDIIGDAPAERYVQALKLLFEAPEVDSVLCMHAPVAISSATEIATAVIKLASQTGPNLLTCWMGEEAVDPARALFHEAGLPTYDTPEQSIQAFLHTIRYRRNQELLMQTPPEAPTEFSPATETARLVVENVLASGKGMMSEPEAKAVLAAYGVPTVETHIVRGPEEASRMAKKMGGRIALKILSSDLSHKSDVGGVVLDLKTAGEVEKAADDMLSQMKESHPDAHIDGFTVQRMARRPGAEELIVGMTNDPIFGPVILFGEGGTAVEIIGDRSVALPPLNMTLARDMIARTRIYKLLMGYRNRPAANLNAVCLTLMQVSQLIIDIPEIAELDINPLFADARGVLALDARIKVAPTEASGTDRLAIRPYPKKLEERVTLNNGQEMLLRPIRPEDEPAHQVFFSCLSREDVRLRFFNPINEMPHTEMARLTQIDYDREMAFIATAPNGNGSAETCGVVRTITDPNNEDAEFAVIVRSDIKGVGLGRVLMEKMINYCRSRGTKRMFGQVLKENTPMLSLAEQLRFKRSFDAKESVWELILELQHM
jgi:acetyltransferase